MRKSVLHESSSTSGIIKPRLSPRRHSRSHGSRQWNDPESQIDPDGQPPQRQEPQEPQQQQSQEPQHQYQQQIQNQQQSQQEASQVQQTQQQNQSQSVQQSQAQQQQQQQQQLQTSTQLQNQATQQQQQQQQQQQRPQSQYQHPSQQIIHRSNPSRPIRPTHNARSKADGVVLHQPHGLPSIGPSLSLVSVNTSVSQPHHAVSVESPLPPIVQRGLGDRQPEKRKNASLEIEALVKSLQEANNHSMIYSVITLLSKDFCTSMNSNYRKGGLVGLSATAIGLMQSSRSFLHVLLPPVLHCFDDPEARVRYYACESLYNIAKVSRQAILGYFNQMFEGLTKLFADVDDEVKNAATTLDKLIKEIVVESDSFQVDLFLPLLQNYIRRTNPYIRRLIVGWITLLDSVPDINMLDYLPDFLDGLFNMLSDSDREIRQAADSALADFLRKLCLNSVVELGPINSVLVMQCQSKERLNRLTAINWLIELIHHPFSGGNSLLPFLSDILGAIMWCISDGEADIRQVAEKTNGDLLALVKDTKSPFGLKLLIETLTNELLHKEDVPTKMAALSWINMLMEKRKNDVTEFVESLLPVLLRTLSDSSDAVVLLNLRVLSRISLAQPNGSKLKRGSKSEEVQFQLVLNAILSLFAKDRQLLETRGSLIIRKLCVLLNAKSVYIRLASSLVRYESSNGQSAEASTLEFISTMIQTLNLILLTASELHDLRTTLANSFSEKDTSTSNSVDLFSDSSSPEDGKNIFVSLFRCWCHNPVAAFALCLLAEAYDLSFALVKRFSEMDDISIGFLMQIDKLVHLIESPIFVRLRLKLLDVESKQHASLLKSIYGILLCLPQGDAFRLLNTRLTTVCNLRDNLSLSPMVSILEGGTMTKPDASTRNISENQNHNIVDQDELLARYEKVMEHHRSAKERAQKAAVQTEQRNFGIRMGNGIVATAVTTNNGGRAQGSFPMTFVSSSLIRGGSMSQMQDGATSSPQRHMLSYDTRSGELR